MARQWTAKDAILAQQAQTTPEAITSPANAVAPASQVTTPTPSPTPAQQAPRVEWQWNYGTAENQVLGQVPAPIQPPTPATPASEKPKTASEAIAQGFKQELKPIQAPLTTEIGREQRLGQLPVTTAGANIEEQNRINEQNLKNASGKQLWDNMNTISTGNSKLLTDRKAFDQAFGYEWKDAWEKALVDAFWKSKQPSTSDLYNALATNSDIPATAKNTPWYNDALLRHQDVTRFENLNPYTLSKVIGTELIPWTQTYNDLLAKNPKLVQDANKLASINTPVTAREEKPNWQDVLSSYLTRSPAMQNPNTVATIMNSDPAIATKTNEVQAIEDKLTEAKNRLQNIKANVTERYKGTGATSATINAKALSESRDITNEITMLEANKASASGALTTLIQNAKDNYTFARQDKLDAENRFNQGFQQLQAMAEMGMKQDSVEYQKQQDAVNRDLALMQYYTNIDQANMRDELGFQRDLSKMDLQQKYGVQNDLRNFEQQKVLVKMWYNNQAYLQNLQFGQQTSLQSQKDYQDRLKILTDQGVPYNDAVAQLSGQTSQTVDRDSIISKYGSTPAVRNFNPWNIMDTWFGGQKVEWERFTRFATPQEWFNALVSKIENIQAWNSKVYSPNMTLLQYISKYAPASDNNNPEAYANGIAKNLWISPSTQIKDIDPNKLALEHARHEDGNMFKMLQDMGISSKQIMQSSPTQTEAKVSPEAKSWVDAWDKWTMDLETILTKIGSAKEATPLKNQVMQYVASRWWVAYRPPNDPAVIGLQKKISEIDSLIKNRTQLENVSGIWQKSWWDTLTSKKQDYLANVSNILQGNVLQELIDAKAKWATFGALSDAELQMLKSSSSPLMWSAIKDGDKITWFNIWEDEMQRQLEKLRDGYIQTISRMTGANQWQVNTQQYNPVDLATQYMSNR